MHFFTRLKAGEYGLAKTTWLFGFLIFVSSNILTKTFGVPSTQALLTYYLIMVAYTYFWAVGYWRAASNYAGFKLWAILAKAYVAFCVLFLLFMLL